MGSSGADGSGWEKTTGPLGCESAERDEAPVRKINSGKHRTRTGKQSQNRFMRSLLGVVSPLSSGARGDLVSLAGAPNLKTANLTRGADATSLAQGRSPAR